MQDINSRNDTYSGGNSEDIVVDMRDVLYSMLRRWPLLLAGLLCGAVLLGAFGVWRGRNAVSSVQPAAVEDRVEAARKGLTPAQAEAVEGMYTQYREYSMLQTLLRDQYVEYMLDMDRVDASYLKTIKFLLTGDNVNPTGIFEVASVLGEEECLEIGKILAGETDLKTCMRLCRNRVVIYSDSSNKMNVSEKSELPIRFVLTLKIIGEYKGQCDQIQAVLERKMLKLQQDYTEAGGILDVQQFSSDYSNDVASYMKDTVATFSTQLRQVTDNLNYFQTNTIDKLDNDSKAYYELLKEQGQALKNEKAEDEGEKAEVREEKPRSWRSYLNKKYLVLGALAGLILAVLLALLQYILSHVLQSRESFEAMYGIPLRGALFMKGPRASGLRMALYRLFHTSDEWTEQKAAAMAQDLGIEMEKKGAGSLYLLLSESSEELRGLAEEMKKDLQDLHPQLDVSAGDPLEDQEQMRRLSGADAAVILVGIRKTRRETVVRQLQMCGRYGVPETGAVSLEVV